jgi:hypothetical protein
MITGSKRTLNIKGNWGFTTYVERHRYNDNGIVLKVVKSGDKIRSNYAYPPGPGIVIQDPIPGWMDDAPLNFIKVDLKKHWDNYKDKTSLLNQDKKNKKNKNKTKYVFFIELCLRLDDSFIQNDLIFMKYY